jgi:O-antigen/teichoic acid export membrane protein
MTNIISHIRESRFIFFNTAFEKISYFLLFLFFARFFSSEIYGKFITINNLGNIIISIACFGIGIQLQSLTAKDISSASKIFSNFLVFILLIIFSDIAAGLILYFGFYSHINFLFYVLIIVWSGISTAGGNIIYAYYGINKYDTAFYIISGTKFITFLAAILSGVIFNSFTICLTILLAGSILFFIPGIYYFPFKIKSSLINSSYLKNIFVTGLPLGFATIFNFLYDKIDIIILSAYVDFSKIAFYGVAYGLFKSSSLSFSFIIQKTLTSFSEISGSKDKLKISLFRHANVILTICIPVAVALYLMSDIIIQFIYTDTYKQSIAILKILSYGIIPMGLNNLTGTFINSLGFYKVNLNISIIAFILNLLFNILFVPVYSIFAAAYISVFTELLILILEIIFIFRYLAKK